VRISILPKTSLGRWSVGLAAAFILLFVLLQTFYASVRRNPVPNPVPPSPVILIGVVARYISGIASFVTGLISMIKSKERSILVFSVVIVGFLALIWLLGEVLFPH
jgi:divalent metal cation (Fe/Co/Zn/Cd) transporter